MRNILLDTNIMLLVLKARDLAGIMDFINPNKVALYISIVTEAELKSIAMQNKWSSRKSLRLDSLLDELTIIEIYKLNVNAYVQIDAYSQRRNPSFNTYPFATPRNMGKNDLWIASLAALLGCTWLLPMQISTI